MFTGASEVPNTLGLSTTFYQASISGSYRYNQNWVFSAKLPYLDAVRRERGAPTLKISGIGDVTLSATLSPWAGDDSVLGGLGFSFGLILPTGDHRDQPQVGVALPSVFQLGSGTTQLQMGLRYATKINDWSFSGSLSGTVALDANSSDFRPAETYFLSLGASRQVTEKLHAKLSLDFYHGGKDEFRGADISNTGSTTFSITPALIYRMTDDLSVSGSLSLPLYREVNETALTIGPLWSLGASYSF